MTSARFSRGRSVRIAGTSGATTCIWIVLFGRDEICVPAPCTRPGRFLFPSGRFLIGDGHGWPGARMPRGHLPRPGIFPPLVWYRGGGMSAGLDEERDERLAVAAAKGDRSAFDALVTRHRRAVYRLW